MALAQLPPRAHRRLLVRTDSAGATSTLLGQLRARGLRFSVGLPIDAHVRSAVLSLPEDAWSPAIDADGQVRDGAWVAEVTGWLDLGGHPPGTRAICRQERPDPGARPRFTDAHGARPPADVAAPRRLAMGHGPGSRIRPTADTASNTLMTTSPHESRG